jgi:hypothetical protein
MGGSEAEQAKFDCDEGLNSAAWALPGDADYNDTTHMTPN